MTKIDSGTSAESVAPSEADYTPEPPSNSLRSLVLGVLVGAVFLFLAVRQLSWGEFLDTLFNADTRALVLGIIAYVGYLLTRAARWSVLLAKRTETRPYPRLFRAVTWGTAANAIVPHSGEFLRVLVTSRPLGISTTSNLGTIAAERLYDFGTVIAVTLLTIVFFSEAPPLLASALIGIAVIGVVALIAVALVGLQSPIITKLIDLLGYLFPKRLAGAAEWQVQELSHGIRASFHPAPSIFIFSAVQWFCILVCIYCSLAAYSLPVSPWLAGVILPLTVAGLTLPTAPAYLGTMQICFLAALVPFGVSDEAAVAASFAYLSIVTLPVVLVSAIWYAGYILIRRSPL